MKTPTPTDVSAETLLPRVLGTAGTERSPEYAAGPTFIVVAGLHGNEPAGVEAALQILRELEERPREYRGEVHFLSGNRKALAERVRYLDRDLNRAWTEERVARLRNGTAEASKEGFCWEDREQGELLAHLDSLMEASLGPVYILDLHTTSGKRGIFTTVGDSLENRALALALPVPLVLGLEELVEGTLQDYLSQQGAATLIFESGQHMEPEAVGRAEDAIRILLAATGVLPESDLPGLAPARKRLARAGQGLPRSLELRHRHPIHGDDGFRMHPGWVNFAPVHPGEPVARDRSGEIRVPERGRLLMPLYQPQGEDGFFLVREFRPFWLHLSRLLRKAGVNRVAHWFPGIRKDPTREDALVVNLRVARWYALQLLHLLGFRRHFQEGRTLVVLRRTEPSGRRSRRDATVEG